MTAMTFEELSNVTNAWSQDLQTLNLPLITRPTPSPYSIQPYQFSYPSTPPRFTPTSVLTPSSFLPWTPAARFPYISPINLFCDTPPQDDIDGGPLLNGVALKSLLDSRAVFTTPARILRSATTKILQLTPLTPLTPSTIISDDTDDLEDLDASPVSDTSYVSEPSPLATRKRKREEDSSDLLLHFARSPKVRRCQKAHLSAPPRFVLSPLRPNAPAFDPLALKPASSASDSVIMSDPSDVDVVLAERTFPARLARTSGYSLFYRRFPMVSYFQTELTASPTELFDLSHPGGNYNPPRDIRDLYTPRFVKGKGTEKVGLCPICVEPLERGGDNKKLWLSMKFSAFKCYHMQYAHGISPVSAAPFSPPIGFRTTARPANKVKTKEKHSLLEGKCHKCQHWVPIEGVKDVEAKVIEIFWWKHAAICHQGSTIKGECDVFVEDEVYRSLASKTHQ